MGLQPHRSFVLRPQHSTTSLTWNGTEFARSENRELSYSELEVNVGREFRDEIQAVEEALYRYAFTCPVPLYWNGERIDGLQLCPDHGVRDRGTPFLLTFSEGKYPWSLPSGTFEFSEDFSNVLVDEWQRLLAVKALHPPKPSWPETSYAFLLSYRVWYEHMLSRWRTEETRSTCYWVRDGVVVDTEKVGAASTLSLAIFLSAQGLESDLTTLHLRDGSDRAVRLEQALQQIPHREMEILRGDSFYLVGLDRSKERRRSGGVLIMGGLIALPFTVGLSSLVALAGWRKQRQCEIEAEAFDQQLNTELARFIAQWQH